MIKTNKTVPPTAGDGSGARNLAMTDGTAPKPAAPSLHMNN